MIFKACLFFRGRRRRLDHVIYKAKTVPCGAFRSSHKRKPTSTCSRIGTISGSRNNFSNSCRRSHCGRRGPHWSASGDRSHRHSRTTRIRSRCGISVPWTRRPREVRLYRWRLRRIAGLRVVSSLLGIACRSGIASLRCVSVGRIRARGVARSGWRHREAVHWSGAGRWTCSRARRS